jgi:alpha-N-arabinofuranosidase
MRTLITILCLFALNTPAFAGTVIKIDTTKPGATINKDVYGQFVEHLGRGIYEGIWVGEDSAIPNTKGYRNDVLQALKDLRVPVMRWPGGCYADIYHWRDGIGPRDKRPRRINALWGGVIENNAFGTHEFLELAEMIGADAYVNANLGTGTPAEMMDWLEYMTANVDSELVELRRANGRDKPWRIKYFAIGNESWNCGGNMSPEVYASHYKRYATFVKTPEDNQPIMIASGGNDDVTEWTDTLARIEPNWSFRIDGISHHYYTLPTGKWETKGKAYGFGENEWFSTFKRTLLLDDYIRTNVAIMDKHDPEGRLGFFVDEWGTWYDAEEGSTPGFLYQQNSLRDALVAAVNFNVFHKHARRVRMTNIAQMINVLQAMILTDKERMLLTPTYHAFKMHVPFQGATALRSEIRDLPSYTFGGESVPSVSVSAARGKDGKLWLSLVNLNPNATTDVEVDTGSEVNGAKGQVLTAEAMDAHNTFDQPDAVKPVDYSVQAKDGKLGLTLPAKSVVVVELF